MSAAELLRELSERGIRIRPRGPYVALSPKSALTPEILDRVRRQKPLLLRELEMIRAEAGEDWDTITSDPKQLRAFRELVMINKMRSQGIAPSHYTATTDCKRCGSVPIWPGCAETVQSCPWCFNRIEGLPMPRREK